MAQFDVIIPASMQHFYDTVHFAPAVRLDGYVLCSGVLGLNSEGRAIEDPEAQFVQAFNSLAEVLAEAGVSFADIVEMTTFHVGLREHLRTFVRVKDRYIAAPYPAMTAIGVSELAVRGALVELKVIARAPGIGRQIVVDI